MKPLREPYNVADAMERDKLVRRKRKIRASVVQNIRDVQHWNRLHPFEQIGHTFEDAMIAWLDSGCEGEMPTQTPALEPGT